MEAWLWKYDGHPQEGVDRKFLQGWGPKLEMFRLRWGREEYAVGSSPTAQKLSAHFSGRGPEHWPRLSVEEAVGGCLGPDPN